MAVASCTAAERSSGWEAFERLSLKMLTVEINMPDVYAYSTPLPPQPHDDASHAARPPDRG